MLPGKLEFFTFPIRNPFTQNEVFTVHINDPDEPCLSSKELMLVNDQAEWRYWVSQGRAKRPNSWESMTPSGDVILQPNDEIELLFKYFTTREARNDPNA